MKNYELLLEKGLKYLKYKDLKVLRETVENCPLCGLKMAKKVVDHKHLYNSSSIDDILNGFGHIRGIICSSCNSIEGKFFNALKRYGYFKKFDSSEVHYIQFLKNLANYIEVSKNSKILHPSEVSKAIKIIQKSKLKSKNSK